MPSSLPHVAAGLPSRRSWVAPTVVALPPLVELTLQTGGPIPGQGGQGGITLGLVRIATGQLA